MSPKESIFDDLLPMSDDFDFIQDTPQDLLPVLSSSVLMKRKSLLNENISALGPHSPTHFDGLDPKHIKMPDSLLPITQKWIKSSISSKLLNGLWRIS